MIAPPVAFSSVSPIFPTYSSQKGHYIPPLKDGMHFWKPENHLTGNKAPASAGTFGRKFLKTLDQWSNLSVFVGNLTHEVPARSTFLLCFCRFYWLDWMWSSLAIACRLWVDSGTWNAGLSLCIFTGAYTWKRACNCLWKQQRPCVGTGT